MTGSNSFWFANPGGNFYNGVATTSLRFNSGSSHHLHRTPAGNSSDTDKKKYTFSTWIKRAKLSTTQQILAIGSGAGGAPWFFLYFTDADKIQAYWYSTTSGNATNSSPLFAPQFRDTSAWYNIVLVVDTTDGTATDRFKLYVNGVRAAVETAGNDLLQNFIGVINSTSKHWIGRNNNDEQYLDGYLAETIMVDGTAIGETSGYLDEFGELKQGVWIPKDYTGSYGTNGFRLKYTSSAHDAPASEGSADTDNIGADSSGQNHHWIVGDSTGAEDCAMPDSPENNFCTMNYSGRRYGQSYVSAFSEGNLKVTNADVSSNSNGNSSHNWGTMAINQIASEGGVYFEVRMDALDTNRSYFGVIGDNGSNNKSADANGAAYSFPIKAVLATSLYLTATTDTDGTSVDLRSGNTVFGNNEVAGVAIKSDGKLFIHREGTYLKDASGNVGNPSTGANPLATIDLTLGDYLPYVGYNSSFTLNFGQDGTFADNETSGENQDANGIGDFMFAVPTNYLAMCSSNMAEPTIGPNSLTQATDHFNTLLYTGDGNDDRTVGASAGTGLAFKPDWAIFKGRDDNSRPMIYFDSTRGDSQQLRSDGTGASNTGQGQESSQSGKHKTFVAPTDTPPTNGGYTVGTDTSVNENNKGYVVWSWKANGGVTTSHSAGDNSATEASVSQANTTSGFSIVTYTGDTSGHGSAYPSTFNHGLGKTPKVIFVKARTATQDWAVYHEDINTGSSYNHFLSLNTTAVRNSANNAHWGGNTMTLNDNLFSAGSSNLTGANGVNYVAYLFADVEGFSKFGNFTGNTSADGTFVALNFSPAMVIVKRATGSSTYDWFIHDNKRGAFNVNDERLAPNVGDKESTSITSMDFLSNGFKIRTANTSYNEETVIYMAFAEAPFKYANAR